jgi:hypothetical protein
MPRFFPLALLLAISCCVFADPSEAFARKGGIIFFNTGDKVFEIAEAEPGSPAKMLADDMVVGYHCQHFGIFWLPIWTWDGDFCVYSEEQEAYDNFSPDEISAMTGVPVDKIKKPFLYSFPLGLIILLVIGVLVLLMSILGRKKAAPAAPAPPYPGMPGGQGFPPAGPPQGFPRT